MIHLTDDRALCCFVRRGDVDAGDLHGNTALHWAANNGHDDCVSFLVNFGVNLWSLNNQHQTAKDLAAICCPADSTILDMLDQAMARQSALNPKSVRKMREKALIDAERRIRALEKVHKKALKKAEKEEKEMERRRRKLLSLPATAAVPSPACKQSLTRNTIFSEKISPDPHTLSSKSNSVKHMHLFESKTGPKAAALRFSDIVSKGTIRSAPKSSSLGAVSRKILHKKLNSHHSMNNLSDIVGNPPSVVVPHVGQRLDPDSGYFSKSSVRSLSGLRRDADVLFGLKEDACVNIYHSMNSLSLKNSSWIEMFRQKEEP